MTSKLNFSDISKQFQAVNISDNTDINILLLGETGVGKSTFINALANYLTHADFNEAEKNDLLTLIPAQFNVLDKNGQEKSIKVGNDVNECLEVGASATQDVRAYVFPYTAENMRIRLIDTPGMGDVRGIDQDNINVDNILSFVGRLKQLHAICFLLKPNNARSTVMFEFCMKQLMSRLHKSACANIMFIFTHSGGPGSKPEESLATLRKIIKDIKSKPPFAEIPLSSDNYFCFDNAAFRYLAATKQGVEFEAHLKKDYFIPNWLTSARELQRMLLYITGNDKIKGLEPHQVQKTMCVNEARRLISQLSQPLAEITELISDNIRSLERHNQMLGLENNSLKQLRNQLYIPVINLKVINLTQPVTVCTSKTCATIYKVGEIKKWHYSQRCHDPCYLKNVPKEIVGSPELIQCAAMDSTTKRCKLCPCDFSSHMHIYYMTETFDDKIEDDNIKTNITNKQEALKKAKDVIKKSQDRQKQLEFESDCIIKYTAQFACFLQNNAITPYNDAYEGYIKYLIDREKSLGQSADLNNIQHLEMLLVQYQSAKSAFDRALSNSTPLNITITPEQIQQMVQHLFNLEINGKKIKELYKTQKTSVKNEHEKLTEYHHPCTVDVTAKKKQSKKGNKQKSTSEGEAEKGKQTKKENKQKSSNEKEPNKGKQYGQRDNQGYNSRPPNYQQSHPPTHQMNQRYRHKPPTENYNQPYMHGPPQPHNYNQPYQYESPQQNFNQSYRHVPPQQNYNQSYGHEPPPQTYNHPYGHEPRNYNQPYRHEPPPPYYDTYPTEPPKSVVKPHINVTIGFNPEEQSQYHTPKPPSNFNNPPEYRPPYQNYGNQPMHSPSHGGFPSQSVQYGTHQNSHHHNNPNYRDGRQDHQGSVHTYQKNRNSRYNNNPNIHEASNRGRGSRRPTNKGPGERNFKARSSSSSKQKKTEKSAVTSDSDSDSY